MEWVCASGAPWTVVGAGANVLFPDAGLPGVVIKLRQGAFRAIRFTEQRCEVGAGVLVSELLRACLTHGLGGCEFLTGIPGTLGGVVAMNAGTREGEMADCLREVYCLDEEGRYRSLPRAEIPFSYRHSGLAGHVVVGALLELHPVDRATMMATISRLLQERRRVQDSTHPNVGCIFRNPPVGEHSAGRLIQLTGLKGFRVGGAEVSRRHANFLHNVGQATSQDVLEVIHHVQQRVWQEHGIWLETEVRIMGSDLDSTWTKARPLVPERETVQ